MMRSGKVLGLVVSFLVVAAAAQGAEPTKAKTASKGKKAVIMPAGDMKWAALDPKSPEVLSVDLWGDHTKGAFGGLTKFPAGFSAPLHSHTAELKIVMISGTLIHGPEGKPEVRLGPGSYLKEPGGYKHTTACDKASECVFFLEGSGKFDLVPAEAKAAAK